MWRCKQRHKGNNCNCQRIACATLLTLKRAANTGRVKVFAPQTTYPSPLTFPKVLSGVEPSLRSTMPSLEVMEATVSGLAARAKFPSVSTLAISFVVTVLLLVLVRAAFNRLATSHYVAVSTSDNDEKDNRTDNESAQSGPTNRSRWSWSWRWQGLRLSLPVSLTISEKDHPETGAGMGVAAALRQQQQQMQQRPMIWHAPRQRSPGFEAPCTPRTFN